MRALVDATEALVAPPTLSVDDGFRAGIVARLTADIGAVLEGSPPPSGPPLVVSLPVLRQARNRPESLADRGKPFVWKPVFVRRSLGLAALDACVAGRFRTPGQAVGPVAMDSVARWEETGWRTFHWEPWFAGLAPGARAMVLAEAVGWATSVWSSLDWEVIGTRVQIGGLDDQWNGPVPGGVRLKGRSELGVPLGAGSVALVSVSGGCPGEFWAEELAYLALVAALHRPSRPVPARVLGLWPDAGVQSHVEVGGEILADAATRVVSTVAAMVEAQSAAAA
jgi:hypothetical protein